jgi:tetratricopeptide (TPR) repeat protein/mono/diheme cytochrome c family protein
MTRTDRVVIAQAIFLGGIALGASTWAAFHGLGFARGSAARPAEALTFNKDIAPIIFQNCSVCHHPEGAGPFSLLTYQDVKKRAPQIAVVTKSRYMPPWLPVPGYGEFIGQRRLSAEQIAIIQQWVVEGAIEGDPSDLPPAPHFEGGWQLGKPDLVLKMPRPYTLPAEGKDVFRNFVIPVPITATRYVRSLEILPGNKRIVHHCNILIDRTGSARRQEEQGHEVGFGGMEIELESKRFEPQTHFLFWKPGTPPYTEPDGMAWRLDRGDDLVLNMHMLPSGKPEVIQASVGLYFTDKPPTRFPMLLQLEHDGALDIPPGKRDFVVTDEFKLPVDVEVLGVYPHAHYLGKEIQGFAILPDGSKEWLIRIENWDINWQAVYQYAQPLFLPKGSTLAMRYTYDNSADNVRNPNHPPRRVVAGNKSTDEMAHLWIQVVPRQRDELKVLQEALMRARLKKYPHDFWAEFNLGAVLQSEGKLDEAVSHLIQALRVRPNDATAHNNLGAAWESMDMLDEARGQFREALKINPDYANAHYNLGNLLLRQGQPEEAIEHFREVVRLNPQDADAFDRLGSTFAMQGRLAEAAAEFELAIRSNPIHADAHYKLGKVYAQEGKLAQAASQFEVALRLEPENADFRNDFGTLLAMQGRFAQAVTQFEWALRINPEHATARENLRRAQARLASR